MPLGPQTITPSVSIGLALTGDDDETAEELLARADAAMYVAKSHGGGRVERAESIAASSTPDLVGALMRGELRMHYQPVVSLATGAVLGVSAVLRWVHPSLGMLPAHQVRTALDSASVLPVVDWCIDRAINDVRTVAPSRVDHVSVWLPVPGRALQATSTRDALRAALAGADGSQNADTSPSLVLDVHESDLGVLARRPALRRQLAALTESGPVALGIEHLSADVLPLGSLQLLGSASASIDPELILAASENEPSEALVRSLVTGATALGVVTVATGISTPELLAEARRLGVHAVCGDLIGPAASLEIYSDLLHGERITLPDMPEVAVVVPHDDELYSPAARPVLAAIRALEEDDDEADLDVAADLDDDVLADDEDAPVPVSDEHSEDAVAETVDLTDEVPAAEPDETAQVAAQMSGRLLLGDVVDLAEQVARELGVALPPPDLEREGVPSSETPDLVDDGPMPDRAPSRLPGLADLHAALGSPEVSRALDDRTDPSRGDGPPPAAPTALRAADPAPASGPTLISGPEPAGTLEVGGSALPLSLAPGLAAEPMPFVRPTTPAPGEVDGQAGDGVSAAASDDVDLTDATRAPDVDLRTRGGDAPRIVVRAGSDDPLATGRPVPMLRLHGRGGSDGGSIL